MVKSSKKKVKAAAKSVRKKKSDAEKTVSPNGGVQLWENGPYWAECNIGATKPEDPGYYFWWGDTVGYKRNSSDDGWVSVKDGAEFEFTSDNCPAYKKGYTDSTGNLVAAHDAAAAHWGDGWRMPTAADFEEMIEKCDFSLSTRNGVDGMVVKGIGAYASKSIFLPFTGWGEESGLNYNDDLCLDGQYWSSAPFDSDHACGLCLEAYDWYMCGFYHYCGRPVRPLRFL